MYPDYRRVDDPAANAAFEALWGMPLDKQPGLTVVEVMQAIEAGTVRGMYIMGENPAMSDPDAQHAREALAALDHLVVQDIFLTETACLADVVLPASAFPEKTGTFTNTDRTVQLGRQAIDPPGQARQDLWILCELAARLGLPWDYGHATRDAAPVALVFDEMRHAMPSIAGMTWARLQREHAVTYPCETEGDPGEPVIFTETFPTVGGRGRFVPADIIPAAERPDQEYPTVLITGRQLEHWHTGSTPARAGDALRARRRWHPARRRVRAVLLLRGGHQQADQPGARPVRQDSGVQVLRDPDDAGRRGARAAELRRRADSGFADRRPGLARMIFRKFVKVIADSFG